MNSDRAPHSDPLPSFILDPTTNTVFLDNGAEVSWEQAALPLLGARSVIDRSSLKGRLLNRSFILDRMESGWSRTAPIPPQSRKSPERSRSTPLTMRNNFKPTLLLAKYFPKPSSAPTRVLERSQFLAIPLDYHRAALASL